MLFRSAIQQKCIFQNLNNFKATEGPLHIAKDCLANRQRRIDYDLVQDHAEKELLKEIELISQVQVIHINKNTYKYKFRRNSKPF